MGGIHKTFLGGLAAGVAAVLLHRACPEAVRTTSIRAARTPPCGPPLAARPGGLPDVSCVSLSLSCGKRRTAVTGRARARLGWATARGEVVRMSVWDALDLVRDLVTDLLALSAFLLALYASKKVDERGEGGRGGGCDR